MVVKMRKSTDNVTRMQRREAQILNKFRKTDNMNQELQKLLTERSIVSVKGKRRSASCK